MLWAEFSLVKGGDAGAATGASIAKTATMHEAGYPRRQPPLPAKIWNFVVGEAQRTILHPGRTIPVRVLASRQQERDQCTTGHAHLYDRFTRNTCLISEQSGDMARKMKIEARRPHPVAESEDARERPRRDAVRERKTVEPAR